MEDPQDLYHTFADPIGNNIRRVAHDQLARVGDSTGATHRRVRGELINCSVNSLDDSGRRVWILACDVFGLRVQIG